MTRIILGILSWFLWCKKERKRERNCSHAERFSSSERKRIFWVLQNLKIVFPISCFAKLHLTSSQIKHGSLGVSLQGHNFCALVFSYSCKHLPEVFQKRGPEKQPDVTDDIIPAQFWRGCSFWFLAVWPLSLPS